MQVTLGKAYRPLAKQGERGQPKGNVAAYVHGERFLVEGLIRFLLSGKWLNQL